jgi:spore coat protein H
MKFNISFFIVLLAFLSCHKTQDIPNPNVFGDIPNYEWVFPEEEVRTLVISIGKKNWDAIQKDMEYRTTRKFGSSTVIPGMIAPKADGTFDAVPGDPIFVEANIEQNGIQWKNVGFRLKGNASLSGSWRSGIYKLRFKLQFDEFENKYPNIKNQRFYGFREISFAPSYGDNTFMKEKLLSTLFRENGVMACKIAYYKIFIDFGEGNKYCGIYQGIESVEEHLVQNQKNEIVGNVYKPESNFTQFSETQFEKQNNKNLSNFRDIKELVKHLNDASRNTEKQQWRQQLEKIFDVKEFLRYLAVNNTVGNWDTYGQVPHNSYLVNINNKLHWIPYDLNLSFQLKGGNNRTALSMDMKEVGTQWPLIKNIIEDPEYYAYYKNAVKEFLERSFNNAKIEKYLSSHKAVLTPHFTGSLIETKPYTHLSSPQAFTNSILDLEKYCKERHAFVLEFVNNQSSILLKKNKI